MKFTSLQNRWVVISGASSGFGAAAARLFGAQGARVLLGARRLDRLEQAAAAARTAGAPVALAHPLDVSDTASANTCCVICVQSARIDADPRTPKSSSSLYFR